MSGTMLKPSVFICLVWIVTHTNTFYFCDEGYWTEVRTAARDRARVPLQELRSASRRELSRSGEQLPNVGCCHYRYSYCSRHDRHFLATSGPFSSPSPSTALFAALTMGSRLHNAPIVIDNGSGTIRAGFAGEDVPKCYFPSYVGRPKHVRTMAGALEGDVFIGPQAQQYKGLFKINYPLEHGIVTDWDDMERIWQYVYQEGLKTVSEDVSERWHGRGSPSFISGLTILCTAPGPPHRATAEPA